MADEVINEDEVTREDDVTVEDATEENEDGTYPAKVVKDLRKENASYREKAKTAESRAHDYAQRLHHSLVAAKSVLADPSDLPFDATHLEDDEKLTAAIDSLVTAKPHLKARRINGDVGQGGRGQRSAPQDFSALLR